LEPHLTPITGRGGTALFSRYVETTGILDILDSNSGFMGKKAQKASLFEYYLNRFSVSFLSEPRGIRLVLTY
jgi:hypothetical protein